MSSMEDENLFGKRSPRPSNRSLAFDEVDWSSSLDDRRFSPTPPRRSGRGRLL
jgi:hypothetical protein